MLDLIVRIRTRPRLLTMLFVSVFIAASVDHRSSRAQAPPQDGRSRAAEDAIADRFFKVLIRRPRPGVALDRVYGFHVQNGTLDEFIASLEAESESSNDDTSDAGNRQMVLGLLQSQRGRQADAAKAFARAETLQQDDFASSYYLGKSLLAIGELERAAAALERAIERKPPRNEALPVFTELGRLYGRAGQNDKALEVWEKLERLFPGDERVGGQIARTLADDGNVDEALRRYESLATSARRDEDKIAFAVQAAEMRRRLGQLRRSTQELEAILAKLRPGSWFYSDVRNRIEQGFLKTGDYDALADYYAKKLRDDRDNLSLRVRLGQILVSAKRLDEAAETLRQAIALAPEEQATRLALVDVLTTKGDMDAAADQCESLAKLDPENPDYLFRWGQVLMDDAKRPLDQRRDAAAEVWGRLAETRGGDAVILSQIADRMRAIEQTEQALALYRRAIDADPVSPQYREYLGEYLFRLGRKDEAVEAWRAIAAGDRRDRESLVRLAEVFGTFDMDQLALDVWRDAASTDLTFPQELRFAEKLLDLEHYDEALVRLDRADSIAETPDEREQLLTVRIRTFQRAGRLDAKIAELRQNASSADDQRELALMLAAGGAWADATEAIGAAVRLAPEDPQVLLVAAEIAEEQNRFLDAVRLFEKLAQLDRRYRTNHLQRVAELRLRLGEFDEAFATCDALIESNPASVESYQFLARLAFRAGRDDEGFAALRKAMSVAPRDNAPRIMLASAFAGRYRTEEAIELLWQAMRLEREGEAKLRLVGSLAPLYERMNQIEELVRRLRDQVDEDADPKTVQMMIATAYETVGDYGQATQTIESLLAAQPRDVSLLEAMVRLCDASDEVLAAAEYQQRIVELADTPENRSRLTQLQLDAGVVDVQDLLNERVALTRSPERLGKMIASALRRSDLETAILICEASVRKDSSLWDVKLQLAQLLLHVNPPRSSESTESGELPPNHRRAIELAAEVRALKLPVDARPPTRAKQPTTPAVGTPRPSGPGDASSSPKSWSASSYSLSRAYGVGQYASSAYSSSGSGLTTVAPNSFGHARVLAKALEMVVIAKHYTGEEAADRIEAVVDQAVVLPPVDQIQDPSLLWERLALESLAGVIEPLVKTRIDSAERQPERDRRSWRLAELDPTQAAVYVRGRLMKAIRQSLSDADASADPRQQSVLELTDKQVRLLNEWYQAALADVKADKNSNGSANWSRVADYRMILSDHFRGVGDLERVQEYAIQDPSSDASLSELVSAISYFLTLRQVDRADALVERLLPAARGGDPTSGAVSNISGTAGSLATINDVSGPFVHRHRMALIDAVIAGAVRDATLSPAHGGGVSDGRARAYVRGPTGGYYSSYVKAPLSQRLMNERVVTELMSLMPGQGSGTGYPSQVVIPDQVIEHLDAPLTDAPEAEQKTRLVLAAFAQWWMRRPDDAYQRICDLCDRFPEDLDLRIEQARLASEVGRPRVALKALDAFEPLDSRMLVRKEMAALSLASQLGDMERAKRAAERLFGLRIDTRTQLILADQMRQLGMTDESAAILRRVQGGRSQDDQTNIQIANAFLESGDSDSAAEVAYIVLKRHARGRASRTTSYRSRAVSILKQTGRLDPIIKQAERRVESTPKSIRAKSRLAELYTAAGKKSEADAILREIAASQPDDPNQLLQRANSAYSARNYREAMELFLDAFEKNPTLFSRYGYQLTRSASQGGDSEELFRRMVQMNPSAIPVHRVDDLIRVGGRNSYSDAKREFVRHVLKSSGVRQNLFSYLSEVPESEREKIPEYREAQIDLVCSPAALADRSPVWRVISRGTGGTAKGPLEPSLVFFQEDPDAKARFLKTAEEVLDENPASRPATLLSALVELSSEDRQREVIETIGRLVANETESLRQGAVDGQVAATLTHISGDLWWQTGQLLQKLDTDIVDRSLLVDIYRLVEATSATNITEIESTIASRLVDVLVKAGRKGEARRYLLDLYARTDHSYQNLQNPGYGDYHNIRAYQSIAAKLDQVGFPIDAAIILKRTTADDQAYARARRWSSRLTVEQAEQQIEALKRKITPQSSSDFLSSLVDLLPESHVEQAIPMWEFPAGDVPDVNEVPAIVIAINTAAEGEQGTKDLQQFFATLSDWMTARPDDWSIAAARLLVAIKLHSSDLPSCHDALMDRIPDRDELNRSASMSKDAVRPLVGLTSVLAMAVEQPPETVDEIVGSVSQYLTAVARSIGDQRLQIYVASMQGSDSGAMHALLDSIEGSAGGDGGEFAGGEMGQVLAVSDCDACLDVASSSARKGDIALSTRALRIALGGGPPIRPIVGGQDVFALVQTSSNPMPQADSKADALVTRLLTIIDLYSDVTGVRLGKRPPGTPPGDDVVSDDSTWQRLDQCLRSIVIPTGRRGMVYPYAKRLISRNENDRFKTTDPLVPESVSIAMARVSAKAGTSAELIEQLDERMQTASDKAVVASLMVQVAWAAEQDDLMQRSLARFSEAVSSRLPAVDGPASPVPRTFVLTTQVREESFRKSDVIDLVLHTLAPIVEADSEVWLEPEGVAKDLLERTARLINSDGYTAMRHREIARRIGQRTLQGSPVQGRSSTIRPASPLLRPAIGGGIPALPFPTLPVPMPRLRAGLPAPSQNAIRHGLIRKLIADGMLARSASIIRSTVASTSSSGRHPWHSLAIDVCVAARKLPPQERYDFLQNVTFGKSDSDPLLHWGGRSEFFSTDDPDADRAKIEALGVCSADVQVLDTLLLLIEVAKATNRSESLAQRFDARSAGPASAASAAAALTRLSMIRQPLADWGAFAAVFEATAADVRKRSGRTKGFSPEVSLFLLSRAVVKGAPVELVEDALRELHDDAVANKRADLIEMSRRVMQRAGIESIDQATR